MKIDQIMNRGVMGWMVILTVFLASCRSDNSTNIPDVSDIDIDLEITRFEQLVLQDTLIDAMELQKIMEEHPAFSSVFFNHVMPRPDDLLVADDPEMELQQIQAWIKHPATRWLYDTVQHIFPDISDLTEALTDAFRYSRYYFPERETPRIYTTISDFGYFPFIYAEDSLRDGIGISLEMFLGETFPYRAYTGLNNAFSDYLTRSYNREHMVRRTLDVWVDDLAGPPSGDRLLDYMIHNGKKLFILQQLMPAVHDSVIIDYPSVKLDWVRSGEKNIWYHFTTQSMLYETSMRKIQKYIGPSPTSPGMPPESPGNTASWLGWQIVRSYMKAHPETSLQQLLDLKDAQVILDQSGYRPPR